jgi:hypothetical protein
VEPQLDEHHAFRCQHAFECADVFQASFEPAFFVHPVGMLHDGVGVPVAKHDANVPLGRQHLPKAPHFRVAVHRLVLGRCERRKRFGADVAWVHPLVEQVDGFTFACAVHAVDQHHHRMVFFLQQRKLRFQQGLAKGFFGFAVGLLAHAVANFC